VSINTVYCFHFDVCTLHLSVPVAARSKAYVCGRSTVEIVGSNPGGLDVCCECCVLSGRGLCVGLITRPGNQVTDTIPLFDLAYTPRDLQHTP
jgi:hypothetical protein